MDRNFLTQLEHVLRPIRNAVRSTVARAVVHLVNDAKKLQLVQAGALAGETIDDAEHHQPYGFSSVPLDGAEAILVFPNGDRGHPIAVAVSDRRHRPTDGEPGEVSVYNNAGARVTLTKDGDIKIRAAPGRQVMVDDGSGAVAIPTMADLNGIISIMNSAGTGSGTALPAAVTAYQSAHPTWPDGTKALKAK